MKHPTPSDFIVNVQESHVSVIFKPSDSYYSFGRLADPEDIARHGPLARSPNARHTKTGDTGDYPSEEVAQMAHTLAVKAVTSPWLSVRAALQTPTDYQLLKRRRALYRHGIAHFSASTATQLRCWMSLLLPRPSN